MSKKLLTFVQTQFTMTTHEQIVSIAIVCHEANKAYCETHGDLTQKSWHEAEEWQRLSAIIGVKYALDNPDAGPADQHYNWCLDKFTDGWAYGVVKDATAKTHPCLVPYTELPEFQRKKDALFRNIVNALR
jgi:hypothetical protein